MDNVYNRYIPNNKSNLSSVNNATIKYSVEKKTKKASSLLSTYAHITSSVTNRAINFYKDTKNFLQFWILPVSFWKYRSISIFNRMEKYLA